MRIFKINFVLMPLFLPAPRCPALLVVGDSSPAVDAVVCRNQPLVFVLNSAVQIRRACMESPCLHPSFPLPSSGW